jgi:hypothetical protein
MCLHAARRLAKGYLLVGRGGINRMCDVLAPYPVFQAEPFDTLKLAQADTSLSPLMLFWSISVRHKVIRKLSRGFQ